MRRKRRIDKEELVDDAIYFGLSALITLVGIFLFDIHWSFYEWPIYPFKFVFNSVWPYIIGGIIGGAFGLFIIKIFLFALQEGTARKLKKIFK